MRGVVRVEQAGGCAGRNNLVPDGVADPGGPRGVDDVELSWLVETEFDLRFLLRPGDAASGLEVAGSRRLLAAGVLAFQVDPDEGVVGAVDVEIEVEGDEMVVDNADDVLGEDIPVGVIVTGELAQVRVLGSSHH